MKNKKTTSILFYILLVNLCCNLTAQTTTTNSPSDTSKSFKVDNYWVTPYKSFEFNSLLSFSNDTLDIVTCAEYVYSPFGLIANKSDINKSLLKNFKVINRVDKMDIGKVEFQLLTLNSSRLILYFDNDPNASKHSYIIKGEIKDPEVNFADSIKVGISIDNFYKAFFDNYPKELLTRFKVIVFESCVQDIKHVYTFENNKLTSVVFVTDTYWNVKY